MDGQRAGICHFFSLFLALPSHCICLSIRTPSLQPPSRHCLALGGGGSGAPPPGTASIYQRRVIETCAPSLSAKRLADCLHFHAEGCDCGGGSVAAPIAIDWDPSHPPPPPPTLLGSLFPLASESAVILSVLMFFWGFFWFFLALRVARSSQCCWHWSLTGHLFLCRRPLYLFPLCFFLSLPFFVFPPNVSHKTQLSPPPSHAPSLGEQVKEADGTQTVGDPIRAPPGALSEYRRISIKHPPLPPPPPSFLPHPGLSKHRNQPSRRLFRDAQNNFFKPLTFFPFFSF